MSNLLDLQELLKYRWRVYFFNQTAKELKDKTKYIQFLSAVLKCLKGVNNQVCEWGQTLIKTPLKAVAKMC